MNTYLNSIKKYFFEKKRNNDIIKLVEKTKEKGMIYMKKIIIGVVVLLLLCSMAFGIFMFINKDKAQIPVVSNEENIENKDSEEEKVEDRIKMSQFINDFYELEDIFKEYMDSYYIDDFKDLYYDLDGDNIKDKITIINNKQRDSVILKLNDVEFDENIYPSIELYIVDLNENDSNIELITFDDGPSADPGYKIYTKNGNEMINVISVGGENLKTDKQGTVIYDNDYNGITYPNIYFDYFTIHNGTVKEESNPHYIEKISETDDFKIIVDKSGLWFFSENIDYLNTANSWIYNNEEREKILLKLNSSISFQIMKIIREEGHIEMLKIRLDDGRIGYAKCIYLAGQQ